MQSIPTELEANLAFVLSTQRLAQPRPDAPPSVVDQPAEAAARPLIFEAVGRDRLQISNAIVPKIDGLRFDWAGETLTLRPGRANSAADKVSWYLQLQVDGDACVLRLPRFLLAQGVEHFLPADELAGAPDEIACAVLEAVLEPLLNLCQRTLNCSLHVHGVATEAPQSMPELVLELDVERLGAAPSAAAIAFGAATGERLQQVLAVLPPAANTIDRMNALPATLFFEAGSVRLRVAELRSLEAGDILLLDSCPLVQQDKVAVGLANRQIYLAAVEGASVTVEKTFDNVMETAMDDHEMDDHEAAPAVEIEELEVKLSFDVGELDVSLADLKTIGPGYIFELEKTPDKLVTVRANGRRVGVAELVEIDGRVGARLREWFSQSHG